MEENILYTDDNIQVRIEDEPAKEFGNACHVYSVTDKDDNKLSEVKFQKGPVKEQGINGLSNEALLSIVIHRLQSFNSSDFSCRENAIALTNVETALLWLNKRTEDRKKRNVEGYNKK